MASKYRKNFNEEIWLRGVEYYSNGNVKSLKTVGDKNVAKVAGSRMYSVTFRVNPIEMRCNCPYALEGFRCKHMAAAFLAFENNSIEPKVRLKEHKKAIVNDAWYPYIKKTLSLKKEIEDPRGFYVGLQSYFHYLNTKSFAETNDFDELLRLVRLIHTESYMYGRQDTLSNIALTLAAIRKHQQATERAKLDRKLTTFIREVTNPYFIVCMMKNYFTKDDVEQRIEFLKQTDKRKEYVETTLHELMKSDVNENQMEQFCITYFDSRKVQKWLIDYYKRTEQYEKAIQLLEESCKSNDEEDDIVNYQVDLIWFYIKTKRTSLRDELLPLLIKKRGINKSQLFSIVRNAMCEDEWNQYGKSLLIEWAKQKKEENCYPVFDAVEAGDLLYERMMTSGYTMHTLQEYYSTLCNYDEGLFYMFFKQFLKDRLRETSNPEWVLNNILYEYPKTPDALHAVKCMIIELMEEYQQNKKIQAALEEFEETLYES